MGSINFSPVHFKKTKPWVQTNYPFLLWIILTTMNYEFDHINVTLVFYYIFRLGLDRYNYQSGPIYIELVDLVKLFGPYWNSYTSTRKCDKSFESNRFIYWNHYYIIRFVLDQSGYKIIKSYCDYFYLYRCGRCGKGSYS